MQLDEVIKDGRLIIPMVPEMYKQAALRPVRYNYARQDDDGSCYACLIGALVIISGECDSIFEAIKLSCDFYRGASLVGLDPDYFAGLDRGWTHKSDFVAYHLCDIDFSEGMRDGKAAVRLMEVSNTFKEAYF